MHGAQIPILAPAPGEAVELVDGVLWARMPLPFALNHVNVYLLADTGGWAVVDTGLGGEATRKIWLQLLSGPLKGAKLTRIIATHHHPDHIGLAGWLAGVFEAPVLATEAEFLFAENLRQNERILDEEIFRRFYRRHRMEDQFVAAVVKQGRYYKHMVSELPWPYHQVSAGERLTIGGRRFEVMTGGGHSSDQILLYCAEDALFLPADQVLPGISPNISVHAYSPEADPLGQYLRSLAAIKAAVPEDVLILPGHNAPFSGLHERIDQLVEHHGARCAIIAEACRREPRTASEMLPLLFPRALDIHQTSFAFGETLAHMNAMARLGQLNWSWDNGAQLALSA